LQLEFAIQIFWLSTVKQNRISVCAYIKNATLSMNAYTKNAILKPILPRIRIHMQNAISTANQEPRREKFAKKEVEYLMSGSHYVKNVFIYCLGKSQYFVMGQILNDLQKF